MSDEEVTPTPARHLQISLVNGLISPVLRIEPDRMGWWLERDVLIIGPLEGAPDADDHSTVFFPREQVMMVRESACKCVDSEDPAWDAWLAAILDGTDPP
jgi:hypothetical protein